MKVSIKTLILLISFCVLSRTVIIVAATDTGIGALTTVFVDLACAVEDLLVPVSFLLVVAAAVIYAIGQVGSAEMRSKAQSWAVWALVGAVVAFAISVIGPMLIKAMYGEVYTCP